MLSWGGHWGKLVRSTSEVRFSQRAQPLFLAKNAADGRRGATLRAVSIRPTVCVKRLARCPTSPLQASSGTVFLPC